MSVPPAIIWDRAKLSLQLLDQRALPHQQVYLNITNLEEACEAISTLAVRGAPAIGIAAAYAFLVSARSQSRVFASIDFQQIASTLIQARPTAVNLAWAVERMLAVSAAGGDFDALHREATAIHEEDKAICRAIGAAGAHLIKPGVSVLTHCNAGALAVSELGTATAPLYVSHAAGVAFKVYADETRPLLQGARLTAWELAAAGIDVTLICDNAAASLMARGEIDMVLVGTDRVTRNGDVVNKIGTLNLAILCKHFQIPFYVACPSSTFDPATATGADVTIEHRAAEEVLGSSAASVAVQNPAFDVTPAELVTALITDHGLLDYTSATPLQPLLER